MATKPTGRPNGRPKGSKSVTTIERERVAAEIAAKTMMETKRPGRKLGKTVLDDFMHLFGNLASHFQVTYDDIMRGRSDPDTAKREAMEYREAQFIRYTELAIQCARYLAPYQSPTYAKMPAPQDFAAMANPMKTIDQNGNNVIDLKDPIAIARVYHSMMTAED